MEKKENKLISFIKSYHTDNFKLNDFILIPFILAYFLMLLGGTVGNLIISYPASKIINDTNYDYIAFFAMYASFIGIWIVILLWCLIPSNRPIFGAVWKKCKGNTLKHLGIGLLIGFVMNGFCILLAVLHKDIYLYFSGANFFALLGIFIAVFIQSSAEELLCRGFLYQRIRRGYRHPAVAIIVNAMFFGLLHIGNPGVSTLAIVSIVVVGICYSVMVYYCDSLWMPMAAHAAWNYTQSIVFGLPNSGLVSKFSLFKLDASTATDSFFYSVNFGVEETIVAVSINVICAILVVVWGVKNKKKPTNIWE
ncbi:CPBP family intramembrane glutamic endopeptidase [Butyrivibrio sp.]|uniref:CPBP family intramembrane glutamic endopeptidase n=1 Tax=Butyrivibrio sp. TaxID=28121 RepID=UPI0025BA37EF|nr:type II CAAX endopeptidase family protein [Butyrivibrio sp.]MBQ9305092.1 CPBP family intramembrane metalloprotease [Butyrivibrio sp.]